MFIYKNIVKGQQGEDITLYQGFPENNVIDFELVAMTNTLTNDYQQKLLIRLKDQVSTYVDEPKFNSKNQFVKMTRVEKTIPVIHTVSEKEDILNLFQLFGKRGEVDGYLEYMLENNKVKYEDPNKITIEDK